MAAMLVHRPRVRIGRGNTAIAAFNGSIGFTARGS